MTRPLDGLHVWLTRPAPHDDASARAWQARGARVIRAATVRVEPRRPDADDVARVEALGDGWIVLPSPRAAENLAAGLDAFSVPLRNWPVAAVGDATAEAAHAAGFHVRIVAARATGADLAARLVADPEIGRVVLASSDRRREELGGRLRAAGREVVDLVVHRTAPVPGLPDAVADRLGAGGVDLLAVYSPSALDFVDDLSAARRESVLRRGAACVGESSADAARALGFSDVIHPPDPGEEGLLDAVADWWAARRSG